MTKTDEALADQAVPAYKSNLLRLAAAQALSMTSMNVNIINTALVGVLLAPMAWLATLPL